MKHEEIQDLLENYVDDRLDRSTRKTVDDHLKSCAECRAILDDVAPVDISALGPSRFDERAMRRTVRRSLFRTAINTVMLLIAAAIAVLFLSALVIQPLVVNRGDRAIAAARATIDITTMINPGAVVVGGDVESGILSRSIALDVVLPVGSGTSQLGPVAVTLGAFDLVGTGFSPPWPFLTGTTYFDEDVRLQLTRLGPGTVATVQITLAEPISVLAAQAIADRVDHDIRMIWAGFDAGSDPDQPLSWTAGGVLGYATCIGSDNTPDDVLGASSGSFGRSVGALPPHIGQALDDVQAGLDNLLSHPELIGYMSGSAAVAESEVRQVAAQLENDPMVRTFVVTGPSSEIGAFLGEYRASQVSAQVLAIDFYNWTSGICGR